MEVRPPAYTAIPVPGGEASGPGAETLASSLVVRLRRAIMNGELRPGDKLKLDALRERLGLLPSRGPLREALSRLGAEGLVLIEDQRGYRVAPVSEKNLVEVATLRVHFESLALRHAIARGDRQWESEIVAALYRLNKIRRVDEAPSEMQEEWERGHRDFHNTLISACDMPLLVNYCSTLHDLNDRYRRLFLARNPFDRNVQDEHEQMAEAAVSRDADRACALMEQHIQRTAANIRERLVSAGTAQQSARARRPRSPST